MLTQYVYDALGQRTLITNARGVTVTHTLYDGLNRPVQVQDALGNATQYTYDLVGNRAVITDANGEVTQHSYDGLNRLITTTYAADGVTVGYQYDAAGNRTQMVDDVGTTTYQYDDFYRLITVTNPITGSVGYGYDDVGNRTQLIYPNGRGVDYTYDGDNRLVQVDDWNNGATTYGYDGAGRLITTTLPNGVVSANAYDDANRLLSLRHKASDSTLLAEYLYELDGAGNRVAVTETVRAPHVEQVVEAYAEQNGLLVVEAENGTATASASHDWVTQTAQSGYEGSGYSRALPDIGARYEETETASSPQLSWPIYNESADTYSVWVRGMAPDAGGDSLHVGLDGGTPSTAADLTGFTNDWGWSQVTPSGDATLDLTATGEHTLEAWMREDGLRVDRVLLVTDTNYIPSGLGPFESPFQTITETVPGGLGTTTISYSYDALYRLTDAAYTGAITATFAYDYDSVGNMTAFTETVDAQTTSVTRSFDVANRLEYAVDASGTTTYTFDVNGNLIELLPPGATSANPVGGVRHEYDQRNLMVGQETNPDGTAWVLQAAYVYDGADDRLRQVDYTGATPITSTYVNDIFGLTQVLVADDGTNEVYNLFGLDLISQDSGSEVRTLLADGLGSVRQEMVGDVVETATTYSPYGEVLERAGASGTVYGFTGEQEDDATGLLYLRARYYDSSLKTFMSRDPWEGNIRQPDTLHGWSYTHNDPVNAVDPSGRCAGASGDPDNLDADCWQFLESNEFCLGTGVDICNGGNWFTRLEAQLDGMCYGSGCINNWKFPAPWTLDELETLRDSIADMMRAFGNSPFDWQQTPLKDTQFSKRNGDSWAPPWRNIIGLANVNERTIWHESGHRLDFEKSRLLSYEYNRLVGIGIGVLCDLETPGGYYYRDYAWNPEEVYGPLYEATYGRTEPFADAYAAWVYFMTRGQYPTHWQQGRAADPQLPQARPKWESIVTNAALSLTVGYGYGR